MALYPKLALCVMWPYNRRKDIYTERWYLWNLRKITFIKWWKNTAVLAYCRQLQLVKSQYLMKLQTHQTQMIEKTTIFHSFIAEKYIIAWQKNVKAMHKNDKCLFKLIWIVMINNQKHYQRYWSEGIPVPFVIKSE